MLGPGDEVIIDIWGNSEATVRQVISPEGSINVSNIGPIYLNGKRIQEASSYLKTMFSRIYSDLASENPSTFLKVTLGQIRSYSSERDGGGCHARDICTLFGNGVSRVVCGRRCK